MFPRRIYILFFTLFCFSLTAFSQTARQVLDETAGKLKGSGGIEATFEATQFKGVQESGTATGRILVQGNKFKMTSNALTTWYDGRTQWTLMNGSDEVNVSTPTAAEQQQMNPYSFVNLYKKGYNLKLAPTTYHGKAAHEVRLTAQNKGNGLQLLILVIDKSSLLPLSIRMKDSRGEWTRIRVGSIRTKRHWGDDTFKFDPKQHPGIEVIDLR